MKKKVQEIIDQLNAGQPGTWVAPDGVHALTRVTKDGDKFFSFNPGSGIPVKVFFNQASGEIRLYPAMMFEDAF